MALKLIREIGYRLPRPESKAKKLYSVYQCPECRCEFEAMSTNVKAGNTTKCGQCAKEARAKTRTKWSSERLSAEALRYETRQGFKAGSPNAYSAARKKGLLDSICGHMKCGKTMWTRETIISEAQNYEFMDDFQKGSGGAYVAARKMGISKEVAAIFECSRRQSDNDAVYIWRVVSETAGNTNIFKVGVTSRRLGEQRIRDCAKGANLCYEIVTLCPVDNAKDIESQIISTGVKVNLGKFNGYTEFVSLTDDQLARAVDLIQRERRSCTTTNGVSCNVKV